MGIVLTKLRSTYICCLTYARDVNFLNLLDKKVYSSHKIEINPSFASLRLDVNENKQNNNFQVKVKIN